MLPGDGLALVAETIHGDNGISSEKDGLGLHNYRYFLERFRLEAGERNTFTLALVRLYSETCGRIGRVQEEDLARATKLARTALAPELLGRFSGSGFSAFHPDLEQAQALALYTRYVSELSEQGIKAAAGLHCHPFLDYSRADAIEGVRKALDYALLLPEPHVGATDSLALTISADRLLSQGDLYRALDEYGAALLADPDNGLARTSMAVALARAGRLPEARRELETVLAADKANLNAWYNLGYVLQKMGDIDGARRAWQRCQKIRPGHVYSLLRLGRLAEQAGRLAQARKYFLRVQADPEGERLVHRHLARLCLAEKKLEQAREHLHQALLHNPNDAAARHLLARAYLEAGEDLSVAESLARQSVSLSPETKAYWSTLAQALEAAGKEEEAREARGRG